MKKRSKIIAVIVWLIIVVSGAAGLFFYVQRELEPVTVYELTQDIPTNSRIGMSDFRAVEIPRQAVQPHMINNPEEYVDMHASSRLYAGSYATDNMFVEPEDVDPFETTDLTNMRQITIPASYVDALGGAVDSGDVVDLVYVGSEQGEDGPFTYSRIFAQEVLVYSVTTSSGYRFQDHSDRLQGEPEMTQDGEWAEDSQGDPGDIAQITLAVEPSLAEEIATRLHTGDIQVVGRFDESENVDTAGFVIGEYNRFFTGEGNAEVND